jgi:hypothetical protein
MSAPMASARFSSGTIRHVSIDFAHSRLFGAGFGVFHRRGRGLGERRQHERRRSVFVRTFVASANRSVQWQQLLLPRGVERPRLVSVRRPVERGFWLDRPLQPQHLWRLREPPPSSRWRSRSASGGAEPRLPAPRAVSASRRCRRRAVGRSASWRCSGLSDLP